MRLLGCAWTQLPCPDSAPASALEADLREALSALGEYEYVLAPLPEDGGHEQHNLVGRLAREIFGAERVCHYATYAHGRRSRVGRQVEIEPGWVELKRRALASYRSQARHPVTAHWFSEDADLSEFVSP
jgi:LmbE family N-acetylglucosaminyl deacetylase